MRLTIVFAFIFALLLPVALPASAKEGLYRPSMLITGSNIRPEASTKQPPIVTLPAGAQVLVIGEAKDDRDRTWYRIAMYDGREGDIFAPLGRALPDFPNPPSGLGTTDVKDETQAANLIGQHGVSLGWIQNTPPGNAIVYEDLGLYYIKGAQLRSSSIDRMDIDGYLTEIDAEGFTLNGRIKYKLKTDSGEVNCNRRGVHRFALQSNGDWNLKPAKNSCGNWTDKVVVTSKENALQ